MVERQLESSAALGEKAEKNGYLLFYVHESVDTAVIERHGSSSLRQVVSLVDGQEWKEERGGGNLDQRTTAKNLDVTKRRDDMATANTVETDNEILEDLFIDCAPGARAKNTQATVNRVDYDRTKTNTSDQEPSSLISLEDDEEEQVKRAIELSLQQP